MGVNIETSIDIDAPVRRVWDQLIDLESWPKWNKYMTFELDGPIKTYDHGTLNVSPDGGTTWKPHSILIRDFDPAKHKFHWGASLPFFMFRASHWLQLTEIEPGRTRMDHYENLNGVLPFFKVGLPYDNLPAKYNAMNEAFKAYVEGTKQKVVD